MRSACSGFFVVIAAMFWEDSSGDPYENGRTMLGLGQSVAPRALLHGEGIKSVRKGFCEAGFV